MWHVVTCGRGNVCVWKRKSVQSLPRRFSFRPGNALLPPTHTHTNISTHRHTLFELVWRVWWGWGMPVLYIELIKLGTWHQQWNALKSITIWSWIWEWKRLWVDGSASREWEFCFLSCHQASATTTARTTIRTATITFEAAFQAKNRAFNSKVKGKKVLKPSA